MEIFALIVGTILSLMDLIIFLYKYEIVGILSIFPIVPEYIIPLIIYFRDYLNFIEVTNKYLIKNY